MKRNRLVIYYLLAWVCYTLYLYIDNVANKRGTQPYVWSNLVAGFIEFSFCFFFVYPTLLKVKKISLLVLGLVVADGLFIGCRYLIEEVFYLWFLGYSNYDHPVGFWYYVGDNWWRAAQPIIFSFVAWALLNTYQKEQEAEQLKQEKTQAELLFLKTQINPHFLYNTLNYLYSLAYPVSDKLADAIVKLSQLMRYMLNNTLDGMLDLSLEIDYLSNYIKIYRLRFEKSFFVDFKATGDFNGKKIASLILIPLVENAFKHGVVNDAGTPIKILISTTGQQLTMKVSNKISYGQKDSSSGIGLVNIRRRLELIYPGGYELLISNNGKFYSTTLHLILHKP
ncbi:histidine kinase [Mucilaginibacter sp. RS28]|uniref:Histidine kinase n=1 Tax=Mucilaginibacter straminoryzae TaxID=2932774 RepID=A0A9X1X0Q2_9SPHI|nr:histidine kinase [Mucilaginibacter straminoryzae]MCJ8209097.1 histidine kinase [Mucilaginibacter straminoryzae]